jgi:hypothetical protein
MKLKQIITEAVVKDNMFQISEELKSMKQMLIERLIVEGVDDPGILKCIFMAGGPGSGKGFTSSELFGIQSTIDSAMADSGLKVINSDAAYTSLLKKNGIDPKDMADIEKNNAELWDFMQSPTNANSLRNQAKKITASQKAFYQAGALGMIIDGTGHEFGKIATMKKEAEELGYDTMMVFVNTSLEVAKQRNLARDRVVPDKILTDSWLAVQNNLGKFKGLFGGNFEIADNTSTAPYEHVFKNKQTGTKDIVLKPIAQNIHKAVARFISKPVQNQIGKNWILTARALKKNNLIK